MYHFYNICYEVQQEFKGIMINKHINKHTPGKSA